MRTYCLPPPSLTLLSLLPLKTLVQSLPSFVLRLWSLWLACLLISPLTGLALTLASQATFSPVLDIRAKA